MEKQFALLMQLGEDDIQALQNINKEQLQKIQERAAKSVHSELVKLGLLVESRQPIVLEESIPFVLVGPNELDPE